MFEDVEDEKFKLSLAFRDLHELNEKVLPDDTSNIRILDLTENNFNGADLRFLNEFPKLKTLIMDKNQLESKFLMPLMINLETLWVNHNKIDNLAVFIQHLKDSCPNLKYLSMLNNKAAPNYFNGGTLIEYNDFRLYVISKLTKLQMLDHKEISAEERMQSQAIYGTERLTRFNDYSSKKVIRKKSVSAINQKQKSVTKKETQNDFNFLPNIDDKIDEGIQSLPTLTDNVLGKLNQELIGAGKTPPPPPPFFFPPMPPPPS